MKPHYLSNGASIAKFSEFSMMLKYGIHRAKIKETQRSSWWYEEASSLKIYRRGSSETQWSKTVLYMCHKMRETNKLSFFECNYPKWKKLVHW